MQEVGASAFLARLGSKSSKVGAHNSSSAARSRLKKFKAPLRDSNSLAPFGQAPSAPLLARPAQPPSGAEDVKLALRELLQLRLQLVSTFDRRPHKADRTNKRAKSPLPASVHSRPTSPHFRLQLTQTSTLQPDTSLSI